MSRVDLRLTIPADARYHPLAVELAVKFAAYVGTAESVAREAGEAVERLTEKVVEGAADGAEVLLEMEADDRALTIRATAGDHQDEATWPLAD